MAALVAAICFTGEGGDDTRVPPKTVCVIINDVRYSPPPRLQAIIARLVQDEDEIAQMRSGKLIFNLGGKSITPEYHKVGEPIEVLVT